MAQKIVQYQAVFQLAESSPTLYNMPLLHRQMLDVLGIKDAAKLIPMAEDQKPTDPVTENQNVLMMKPVKAFAYQDHQAHITVHTSAMQDPKIMQLLQGNPQAPAVQQAMMAHINEHLGFAYRIEIEKQLGFNLPPQKDASGEDIHIDPDAEARLAPLLSQAAQQLLTQNQAEAAQQQAAQQAQDPIIQMQMQELQLKAQENQRKATKDQADIQLKQQKDQADFQLRQQKDAAELQFKQQKEVADTLLKAKDLELKNKKLMADVMLASMENSRTKQKDDTDRIVGTLEHAAKIHHEQDQNKRDRALDILKHGDELRSNHEIHKSQMEHQARQAKQTKPKSEGK
jgi:hypothetical protein